MTINESKVFFLNEEKMVNKGFIFFTQKFYI